MKYSLRSKLFKLGVVSASVAFLSTSALGAISANADSQSNIASENTQVPSSQDITNAISKWKASHQQINKVVKSDNHQYNDFVQKFDKAISLSKDGKYSIDYSNLPVNTTNKEIQDLQNMINSRNASIENANTSNVSVQPQPQSKSVIVSDGQPLNNMEMSSRGWFHQGKTYTRSYWWGYRVHISKRTLRQIGNAAKDAGGLITAASYLPDSTLALLPEGISLGAIGTAVGVVGIGLSYAPGGIVFNYSPGAGVWSVGLQ